jgi:alkanesulfonate monooxygenase SsuD/methylene tetrahydromethanopterin reductase-like flavin-dependent oxidoreductase (luciferase family)
VWFGGTLSDRMLRRVVELGDGWIPIMGATAEDVRDGAARIAAAAGRRIDIQSRVSTVLGEDGKPDAVATIAGVPDLVAAGVTDVTVNIAAFAPTVDEAPEALESLGTAFRKVTA